MNDAQSKPDEAEIQWEHRAEFEQLIADKNFLGAWVMLKESRIRKNQEARYVGSLANSLVEEITLARKSDDRERVAYLRSLLAYVLKDFPGLASLYREQIKGSGALVPDGIQDVWQEFNDILAGRKGLDEAFKQRVEEARARVERDSGLDGFIKEAQQGISKGFEGFKSFVDGLFAAAPDSAQKSTTEAEVPKDSAASGASGEKQSIKVKVEDADAPLPHDIKDAETAKPAEGPKKAK